MPKFLILAVLAAVAFAQPLEAQSGPKFGKNGGVGSTTSTVSSGEPAGGTYSINGITGKATFRSQSIGDPTDSAAPPVSLASKGPTPTLAIGASIYPTNIGGSGAAKYDATSNVLANTIGAKFGLFGAAAKDNVTWLNSYISGVDSTGHAQVYSISTTGNYGGVFAARSSDNHGANQNVIGAISTVLSDNTTQSDVVWAGYDAAYVEPTAVPRGTFGREISLINNGPGTPEFGDPYNYNVSGFTNALRVDCGDGITVTKDCGAAIAIIPNLGIARAGIVFGDGVLRSVGGYAPAIAMPSGYGFSWYTATAVPVWRVFSNASGSALSQMILGDGTLDIYTSNGSSHPFAVTSAGISASGYQVGATAGVSCAAGTVTLASLVVTNGIVTHC